MNKNEKELNILMVTPCYFPHIGGIETHVYEVGWRLAQANARMTVLTTDVSGKLPSTEVLEGVQVIRVPAWPANKDYYLAPAIYRIIAEGQWDLVHCQGYHTLVAPMAMFTARKTGIPYVVTFHSGGDSSHIRSMFRGVQRTALRPLLARAERLIGPSKWEVEFFREKLHLAKERFIVIPNGSYHLPKLAGSPQEKNGKLIVSIGRLVQYKGHHRVIAALPKVLEQVPDARLRIVGTGPYEAVLQRMTKELGVEKHVEIRAVPPGDSDGVASIIAQADLVTLLSEHEAQGIAVLEALSLKRPVLVADTTALQEFAEHGFARSVSLESTSEEVAAAIVQQLQDPLTPGDVELPTWDKCATDLLALYQSIVWKS